MITTQIILKYGKLVSGKLVEFDSIDMEIYEFNSGIGCDSINTLLGSVLYENANYAELKLYVTGHKKQFLIGSFRKVKLKTIIVDG